MGRLVRMARSQTQNVGQLNANIHYILCQYLMKMCGTKKVRTVLDGLTFANNLDAGSECLLCAVVAQGGLQAFGTDLSNASMEAPPPKQRLYMRSDEACCEWVGGALKMTTNTTKTYSCPGKQCHSRTSRFTNGHWSPAYSA
jgi:hypothetical protein